MRVMTISWATQRVHVCTEMYVVRISTFSTKSRNPIVGALQSLLVTKLMMMQERSHKDFCSRDFEGSLPKGD